MAKNAVAGRGPKSVKKKATAKASATRKIAGRRHGVGKARVPTSAKEASQSRFPGETPLTGEDRPSTRAGGKVQGQQTSRRLQKRRPAG